jgi:chromosome segregation ATPase
MENVNFWVEIIVALLTGLVAAIPLVIKLVQTIKDSVKAKNWTPLMQILLKLMAEADKLQESIDKAEAKLEEKKKRLKEIDDQVKKYMTGQFRDGDKKVEIPGKKFTWTLTRSERTSLDSTTLKKELPDVFGKYQKKTEVLTLKKALIEDV